MIRGTRRVEAGYPRGGEHDLIRSLSVVIIECIGYVLPVQGRGNAKHIRKSFVVEGSVEVVRVACKDKFSDCGEEPLGGVGITE